MSVELAAVASRNRRSWRVIVGIAAGGALLAGLWTWKHHREALPDLLREQSRQAAARGRWRDVDAVTARLISLEPRDAEAWLVRARAQMELGDVDGSARTLDQMPVEGPQKLMALQALAELQLGMQNSPRAAEQTWRRILARDPASAFAHQRLISFYALTLQRQALGHEARLAVENECEPVEAYVYLFFADELEFTNAVELNRRWLEGEPNSELYRVAEAFNLARVLAGGAPREDLKFVQQFRELADNVDRAMAELLRKYPANLDLLAWHLERAIEHGDVDRAIELLATVPAEADDDNRFWRFAGWAKLQLGRPDEADADYTRALRLNPLDWSTRNLLAALCRQQQRFDDVEKLQRLVTRARDLARAVKALPDVRSVPDDLLRQMSDYAGECGDDWFAESLRKNLTRRSRQRRQDG